MNKYDNKELFLLRNSVLELIPIVVAADAITSIPIHKGLGNFSDER